MKPFLVFIMFSFLLGCNDGTVKIRKLPFEMKIKNFAVSDFQTINVPFSVRPLALSPDKNILYTCELQGIAEIHGFNLATGLEVYTNSYVVNPRFCKSMDTHSSGRVYFSLSSSDEIGLADFDLTSLQYIPLEPFLPTISDTGDNDIDPQQVYVYKNYLYVSSDQLGQIYRFNLDPNNGDILTLDTAWGTAGIVQVKDGGGIDVDTTGELLNMVYEPRNGSLYAVLEGLDAVVQIKNNGATQTYDVLDIPSNASPHDIDIFNEYLLVSYGALDGTQNQPNGIGVFYRENHQYVTTLVDTNQQLRNAQGIVTDDNKKTFYVVDGFFGAPNDITLPLVNDPANQNILMKFHYTK